MRKIFALIALMLMSGQHVQAQNPLAPRVLVVYDPHVTDSMTVANHYLASRGIASGNLCAIAPPETVTQLTWLQYVSAIKTPIQNCLNLVGPDQVLYIVLSYIRPFSILGQNGKVYALDQYVADIWDQYSATDASPYPTQTHPYFAANQAQANVYQPFLSFSDYRTQSGALRIYSVWRLDGATATLANGMVDKALSAETKGLSGQACFDRQYGAISSVSDTGYGAYDWDLHMAAAFAGQAGFSVTEDQNSQEFGTLPAPNCPNAAMYAGWYSLNHYNNAFTWNTGAIGFHLDSLSAMDPRAGTNWSANAIQKGITITSGTVAEPYLTALSHADGVYLHLFRGGNVGDAFLRNTGWLKWMTVNIGDPLYRPFPGGLPPFNGQAPQSSLAIVPQNPVGPQTSSGTVTLASAAPSGGLTLNLTSSNPNAAAVPSSIAIGGGARTASFPITASAVNSNTLVTITASGAGMTLTNSMTVMPLVKSLSLAPTGVIGGGTLTATVAFNEGVPVSSDSVQPSSSNTAAVPVPISFAVPMGATAVNFSVPTNPVSSATAVTLGASVNGIEATAVVTIQPVLSALTLSATSVTGGTSAQGMVALPAPAYAGGITISLSSSNTGVAAVPSSITIPAGATSGTFNITTPTVLSTTSATITATGGASVKQVVLTVAPTSTSATSTHGHKSH